MVGIGHHRGKGRAGGALPHPGCGTGLAPGALRVQIGAHSVQDLPHFGARRSAMRDRMTLGLRDQGLPGDAGLMTGGTGHGREMMKAGGLAGFSAGQRFFAGVADAV